MKVKELIACLQKCNMDDEIFAGHGEVFLLAKLSYKSNKYAPELHMLSVEEYFDIKDSEWPHMEVISDNGRK